MLQKLLDGRFVRLKAIALHLAFSAISLSVILILIFAWYPTPFFSTDGGLQGFPILVLVDLVLGPLLTAIIVKPNKSIKKIRFDLICTLLVKFLALTAGMAVIWDQRPVAVIHYQGAFYPITPGLLRPQQSSAHALKRFGLASPVFLHHEGPHVQSDLTRMLIKSAAGIEEFRQTERFRPLAQHMDQVIQNQVDIRKIAAQNQATQVALRRFVETHPEPLESLTFQVFHGRYGNAILAFTAEGQLVGSLPAP